MNDRFFTNIPRTRAVRETVDELSSRPEVFIEEHPHEPVRLKGFRGPYSTRPDERARAPRSTGRVCGCLIVEEHLSGGCRA